MTWVAVALLAVAVGLVALRTVRTGWSSGVRNYRYSVVSGDFLKDRPRGSVSNNLPERIVSLGELVNQSRLAPAALPFDPSTAVASAIGAALEVGLDRTRVYNFTRAIMFSLFVGWGFPIGLVGVVSAILALRRPLESRAVAVWALVLGLVSVLYSAGWLLFAASRANLFG